MEPMKLSAQGLELIKRSEGFRGQVYQDAGGLPTIGYGHRLTYGENYGGGITEAQACVLLMHDVSIAAEAIRLLVAVDLLQGQFDALVDFVYNVGSGRLASSTLLEVLNEGDYDAAAQQILRWDHALENGKEVELAGLTARREAEFALWRASEI